MCLMKGIVVGFCCFILSACATISDQAYHKIDCLDKDTCSDVELDSYINPVTTIVIKNGLSAHKSDEASIEESDKIKPTTFSLFYLEYDESGQKFEGDRQMAVIRRAIDTSDKPIYLVVYVHGWNNNADTTSAQKEFDTVTFPYLLARRSVQNPEMNIIGIYVGWRGAKYKYSPAKFLKPLDRARVADEIGSYGEVRGDLISLAKRVEKSTHSGYSLIIGHSFGGRLLSRAFINDLAGIKSIDDWPLGSQSLLMCLNPAISAKAFDEVFNKTAKTKASLQRPIWLNVTSKDDFTTRRLYPMARFIGQNLSTEPSTVNQTHKTIGHYEPYLSYELVIADQDKLSDTSHCNPDDDSWFEVPSRELKHNNSNNNHQANKACSDALYLYGNRSITNEEPRNKMTELIALYEKPAKESGYIWNIRIDESMLEQGSAESVLRKGAHSADVRAVLGRMLDDMLFTPPEKPLD